VVSTFLENLGTLTETSWKTKKKKKKKKKTHSTTSSWQPKAMNSALTEVLLLIRKDLDIAHKNIEEIIQHSQVRA